VALSNAQTAPAVLVNGWHAASLPCQRHAVLTTAASLLTACRYLMPVVALLLCLFSANTFCSSAVTPPLMAFLLSCLLASFEGRGLSLSGCRLYPLHTYSSGRTDGTGQAGRARVAEELQTHTTQHFAGVLLPAYNAILAPDYLPGL